MYEVVYFHFQANLNLQNIETVSETAFFFQI